MRQVIYTSAMTSRFDVASFRTILQRIRVRNKQYGVSGILYIYAGSLLHTLEGPDPYLSATFGRILRDPRHTSINILSVKEVPLREFGQDPMALFDHTEEPLPANGPLGGLHLRPLLTLNESAARRFLRSLSQPAIPERSTPLEPLKFIPYDSNPLRRPLPPLPAPAAEHHAAN